MLSSFVLVLVVVVVGGRGGDGGLVVLVLLVVVGAPSSVAGRAVPVRVQAVPVLVVSLLDEHEGQLGHPHAIRQTFEQLQRPQLAVVARRFDPFRSSDTDQRTAEGRDEREGPGTTSIRLDASFSLATEGEYLSSR